MAKRYDLIIVGLGSGGMSAAEFASGLGLRVAAVERDRVGGDCLWTGCVPSKALLASAKAAHTMRHGSDYGLPVVDPEMDTELVWKRLKSIQADIAATDDSPERFESLGVDLVRGTARLTGPREVVVDGVRRLKTRYILVCTGSRPATPPIEGIEQADILTSENVFELDRAPASLVMIGGGPISVELAQAFTRLSTPTTVLQRGPRLLPRDEPAVVDRLSELLTGEGVDVWLDSDAERIERVGEQRVVHGISAGQPRSWKAEAVLVAAGRKPNVEGLGLAELGVEVGHKGIEVDERLRTAVPSVYAAGDVAGRNLFTHSAGYEAVRAVRDMFFPGRGTADALVPWCTFTDPELAHAGLTSTEAREAHGDDVEVVELDLAHSDRARAEGASGVLVLVSAKDRLVGAHLLAPAAGETIHELLLAMKQGLALSDLASLVHIYPTLATGVGQLAAHAAYAKAARWSWLTKLWR
ncbi:FAD-dependent oxidoreductase [soil metagenome]